MRAVAIAMMLAACGAPARPAAPLANHERPDSVPGSVSGRITDSITGAGATDTTVTIVGDGMPAMSAQTSTDGRFRIANVPPGRRVLTVYYLRGVKQMTIVVQPGRDKAIELALPIDLTPIIIE